MAEIFTLLVDIALGAMAYRLARTNARDVAELRARVQRIEEFLVGLGLPIGR